MSRSGYSDDFGDNQLYLYRQAVERAIRGKRGQALLRALRDALDAMPVKRLITEEIVTAEGDCCALGCLALARGLDVSNVDPEDPHRVAKLFDIAPSLAREIVYENDEWYDDSEEARWERMRRWVDRNILEETATA